MKNELVVKGNVLINAAYNLELTEQRIILLAIVQARETGQGITADSKLQVHAGDYMCLYGVDKHAAYKAMKDAVENLFSRQFTFTEERTDGKKFIVKSRWVSRIAYATNAAILEITFAPDVVPLITRLEQHFTSYKLLQIANLTSKYAIRLYEIIIAWKSVKQCHFELEKLRECLGLGVNEYKLMHQFKSRVLNTAIEQINQHTDITVTVEQQKDGRTITGFTFKFREKPKPEDEVSIDHSTQFISMTDAQVSMYGNQLARIPELANLAVGNESYESLAARIKDMLRDPNKQAQFVPHLKNLGFNTGKKSRKIKT